jgi:hypothetical protein
MWTLAIRRGQDITTLATASDAKAHPHPLRLRHHRRPLRIMDRDRTAHDEGHNLVNTAGRLGHDDSRRGRGALDRVLPEMLCLPHAHVSQHGAVHRVPPFSVWGCRWGIRHAAPRSCPGDGATAWGSGALGRHALRASQGGAERAGGNTRVARCRPRCCGGSGSAPGPRTVQAIPATFPGLSCPRDPFGPGRLPARTSGASPAFHKHALSVVSAPLRHFHPRAAGREQACAVRPSRPKGQGL